MKKWVEIPTMITVSIDCSVHLNNAVHPKLLFFHSVIADQRCNLKKVESVAYTVPKLINSRIEESSAFFIHFQKLGRKLQKIEVVVQNLHEWGQERKIPLHLSHSWVGVGAIFWVIHINVEL